MKYKFKKKCKIYRKIMTEHKQVGHAKDQGHRYQAYQEVEIQDQRPRRHSVDRLTTTDHQTAVVAHISHL